MWLAASVLAQWRREMSSGVRVTVALIVIAFVAIGLYYASLDMPGAPASGDKEPLLRSEESSSSEIPVSGDSSNSVDAVDPVDSVIGVEEWEEPSQPRELDAVVVDAVEETPSSDVLIEESVSSTDEEPAPGVPSDVDVESEEELSVQADDAVEAAYGIVLRESLGVPSTSVLYAISASRFTTGINAEEVVASFDPSSASVSPAGTAWVRMAPWVKVPESVDQPWIVAADDDDTWVLVRDDAAGSMRLEGQVASSRAYVDRTLNRPRVEFILAGESPVEMTELTSDNIGRGLAVVIDGEIVYAQPALNVQGGKVNFLPTCDNEVAAWIARRIKGEYEPRISSEDQGTAAADSVEVTESRPKGGVWIVSKGDTLSSIAEEYFGDETKWNLIKQANPDLNESQLAIGDTIILPPRDAKDRIVRGDGVHVVVSGETLSDIAVAYYGKAKYWNRIYEANVSVIGDDPEKLEVGMRLKMPVITAEN
jgi:LysM repeat protein